MKTALRLTITAFGLAIFNLTAATLLVSLGSTNPVAPFATWATAANVIQDAVDASKDGDTVLVTNGVYGAGGRMTTNQWGTVSGDRVSVTNAIRLESVNGPLMTTIDGGRTLRCVYLGTDAVLSGLTLSKGYADKGAAVFCEPTALVTNCTLTDNWASIDAGGAYGGTVCTSTFIANGAGGVIPGATAAHSSRLYGCTLTDHTIYPTVERCALQDCILAGNQSGVARKSTLVNCTVMGNRSVGDYSLFVNCVMTRNDSGVFSSTLFNCTVVGNSGVGVRNCTVYNSVVYYNAAGNYAPEDLANGKTLNYCCTVPLPTNGLGNIASAPLFVDFASGDLRLQEGSTCIDTGTNVLGFALAEWSDEVNDFVVVGHVTDSVDLLGNTRLIDGNYDGTVSWDIGAYEFNSFKPPLLATYPQLTPEGWWKANIKGAANRTVVLQRSLDLKSWVDCGWGWMGAEGEKEVLDVMSTQERGWRFVTMFYRVVVP